MDSGFFISELNGFPRAYVNHMLDTIGIDGLLKLLAGVENRYGEFRTCLAFYDGNIIELFESKSPGKIANEISGTDSEKKWSDLWYIFMPEHFDKTLAEFSEEDTEVYNQIKEDSCMKKFGEWFLRY